MTQRRSGERVWRVSESGGAAAAARAEREDWRARRGGADGAAPRAVLAVCIARTATDEWRAVVRRHVAMRRRCSECVCGAASHALVGGPPALACAQAGGTSVHTSREHTTQRDASAPAHPAWLMRFWPGWRTLERPMPCRRCLRASVGCSSSGQCLRRYAMRAANAPYKHAVQAPTSALRGLAWTRDARRACMRVGRRRTPSAASGSSTTARRRQRSAGESTTRGERRPGPRGSAQATLLSNRLWK